MEGERGMARETKVGLIAGLAFIICFAVILANRGQKPTLTTHRPYLVDRGVEPLPEIEPPRHDLRRNPSASQVIRERTVAAVRQPVIEAPAQAAMPSSGAQVVFDRPQTAQERALSDPTPPPGTPSRARTEPEPTHAATTVDVDTSRVLTSRDDVEQRRRFLQQQLDALDVSTAEVRGINAAEQMNRPAPLRVLGDNAVSRAAHSVAERAPTRVDRPRGKHTVAAGDNLSKIAAKYYGTKSRRVVDAIFQANRASMESADTVRIGMELILPAVDGEDVTPAPQGSPAVQMPSTAPPHGSTPSQATFRWYQIKKNDGYAGIARRELGDEARWREIFELNKDKFPDPQTIREGVRIKLPAASVANAAGGRR